MDVINIVNVEEQEKNLCDKFSSALELLASSQNEKGLEYLLEIYTHNMIDRPDFLTLKLAVLNNLSLYFEELNNCDRALFYLFEYYKINPNEYTILLKLYHLCFKQGYIDEAEHFLNQIIAHPKGISLSSFFIEEKLKCAYARTDLDAVLSTIDDLLGRNYKLKEMFELKEFISRNSQSIPSTYIEKLESLKNQIKTLHSSNTASVNNFLYRNLPANNATVLKLGSNNWLEYFELLNYIFKIKAIGEVPTKYKMKNYKKFWDCVKELGIFNLVLTNFFVREKKENKNIFKPLNPTYMLTTNRGLREKPQQENDAKSKKNFIPIHDLGLLRLRGNQNKKQVKEKSDISKMLEKKLDDYLDSYFNSFLKLNSPIIYDILCDYYKQIKEFFPVEGILKRHVYLPFDKEIKKNLMNSLSDETQMKSQLAKNSQQQQDDINRKTWQVKESLTFKIFLQKIVKEKFPSYIDLVHQTLNYFLTCLFYEYTEEEWNAFKSSEAKFEQCFDFSAIRHIFDNRNTQHRFAYGPNSLLHTQTFISKRFKFLRLSLYCLEHSKNLINITSCLTLLELTIDEIVAQTNEYSVVKQNLKIFCDDEKMKDEKEIMSKEDLELQKKKIKKKLVKINKLAELLFEIILSQQKHYYNGQKFMMLDKYFEDALTYIECFGTTGMKKKSREKKKIPDIDNFSLPSQYYIECTTQKNPIELLSESESEDQLENNMNMDPVSILKLAISELDFPAIKCYIEILFNRIRCCVTSLDFILLQELHCKGTLKQLSYKFDNALKKLKLLSEYFSHDFNFLFFYWCVKREFINFEEIQNEFRERISKSEMLSRSLSHQKYDSSHQQMQIEINGIKEQLCKAAQQTPGLLEEYVQALFLALDNSQTSPSVILTQLKISNALLDFYFSTVNKETDIAIDRNSDIRSLIISYHERLRLRNFFDDLTPKIRKITIKFYEKLKKDDQIMASTIYEELMLLFDFVLKFVLLCLWVMDYWFKDAQHFVVEAPLRILYIIAETASRLISIESNNIGISNDKPILSFKLLKFIHTLFHSLSSSHLTTETIQEIRNSLHKKCFPEELQIKQFKIIFNQIKGEQIIDQKLSISFKEELLELFNCFYNIGYKGKNNVTIIDDQSEGENMDEEGGDTQEQALRLFDDSNGDPEQINVENLTQAILVSLFTHVQLLKAPISPKIIEDVIKKNLEKGSDITRTWVSNQSNSRMTIKRAFVFSDNFTQRDYTYVKKAFSSICYFLKKNTDSWCYCKSFEKILTNFPDLGKFNKNSSESFIEQLGSTKILNFPNAQNTNQLDSTMVNLHKVSGEINFLEMFYKSHTLIIEEIVVEYNNLLNQINDDPANLNNEFQTILKDFCDFKLPIKCRCLNKCFADELISFENFFYMFYYTAKIFDDTSLLKRLQLSDNQEEILKLLSRIEKLHRNTFIIGLVHYYANKNLLYLVVEQGLKLCYCMIELFRLYADNYFEKPSWKKLCSLKTHDVGVIRIVGLINHFLINGAEFDKFIVNECNEAVVMVLLMRHELLVLNKKFDKAKKISKLEAFETVKLLHNSYNIQLPAQYKEKFEKYVNKKEGGIGQQMVDTIIMKLRSMLLRDQGVDKTFRLGYFFLLFLESSCTLISMYDYSLIGKVVGTLKSALKPTERKNNNIDGYTNMVTSIPAICLVDLDSRSIGISLKFLRQAVKKFVCTVTKITCDSLGNFYIDENEEHLQELLDSIEKVSNCTSIGSSMINIEIDIANQIKWKNLRIFLGKGEFNEGINNLLEWTLMTRSIFGSKIEMIDEPLDNFSINFMEIMKKLWQCVILLLSDLYTDCVKQSKKLRCSVTYCNSKVTLLRTLAFFFVNQESIQFNSNLQSLCVELLGEKLSESVVERDFKFFLVFTQKNVLMRDHLRIRKIFEKINNFLPSATVYLYLMESWKKLKKIIVSYKEDKSYNKIFIYMNYTIIFQLCKQQFLLLLKKPDIEILDRAFFYDILKEKLLLNYLQRSSPYSWIYLDPLYRVAYLMKCYCEDPENLSLNLLSECCDMSYDFGVVESENDKKEDEKQLKITSKQLKKHRESIFKYYETNCKKKRIFLKDKKQPDKIEQATPIKLFIN